MVGSSQPTSCQTVQAAQENCTQLFDTCRYDSTTHYKALIPTYLEQVWSYCNFATMLVERLIEMPTSWSTSMNIRMLAMEYF